MTGQMMPVVLPTLETLEIAVLLVTNGLHLGLLPVLPRIVSTALNSKDACTFSNHQDGKFQVQVFGIIIVLVFVRGGI